MMVMMIIITNTTNTPVKGDFDNICLCCVIISIIIITLFACQRQLRRFIIVIISFTITTININHHHHHHIDNIIKHTAIAYISNQDHQANDNHPSQCVFTEHCLIFAICFNESVYSQHNLQYLHLHLVTNRPHWE